jgi:pimeloyl-ACP methyl ester carboxylesterase
MTYHSQKKQFQLTNKSDNLSRREALKISVFGLSAVGLGTLGMMSTPGAGGFAAAGDHEEKTYEVELDDDDYIHRADSADGTQIAGRVAGNGPPLVFFHGGMTDGEYAWSGILPYLTDQFTCYLPSMRGTGLSADHPDQRPERHMEDLAAFIDSIGEPVGLFGHSSGGMYGFGAVQQGANVAAMTTYEPAVFEFWQEGEDAERFQKAVGSMAQAADEGRLADGARDLLSVFSNEEEISVMEEEGHFVHAGQYVPKLLQIFEQGPETEAPNPNDPPELSRVDIPVLLMYGTKSTDAHIESVHFLDEHLPNSQVKDFSGLGHMAPELGSKRVADALTKFFTDKLDN